MQLENWLKKEGRTKTWMANMLGVPTYKLTRIIRGIGVDAIIINEVSKITNGEVNINDWVKLEKARKK